MIQEIFAPELIARIRQSANLAVVVIDEPRHAVPLAKTLLEGGVSAIELTLRTPSALDAIRRIVAEVPEMLVGAGTVLTPEQLRDADEAGAAFAVAPGMNPAVVSAARDRGVNFAPGVMTPSDIEQALAFGCRLLKFFPAEAAGGLSLLKSMAAPYLHLGLSFIPLGGLKPENTVKYFESPLIAACGGSWICSRQEIEAEQWDAIRSKARQAAELAREARDVAVRA